MNANAPTVTESVRIPLHSLQADLEYLIGRVIADGSCGSMVVKSMRERLDQIEASLLWKPIATAPKDGTLLLLFNEFGNQHIGKWGMRYLGDPGPEAWCDGKYIALPTHWMPLPAPPLTASDVGGSGT